MVDRDGIIVVWSEEVNRTKGVLTMTTMLLIDLLVTWLYVGQVVLDDDDD